MDGYLATSREAEVRTIAFSLHQRRIVGVVANTGAGERILKTVRSPTLEESERRVEKKVLHDAQHRIDEKKMASECLWKGLFGKRRAYIFTLIL